MMNGVVMRVWKYMHRQAMKYSLTSLLSAFVILVSTFVMVVQVRQGTPRTGTRAAGCKVIVGLGTMAVNAYTAPFNSVVAGDTVCIEAGDRAGILEIKNFRGAAGKPITFVNSGGRVRVDGRGNWTAVYLKNDEYIRLTGTGSADAYGFEIFNSGNSGAVHISAKTRYVEVDHVEIHNVRGSGITAKTALSEITDANGNGSVRDEWTQYDTYLHHNWLYDIGTEGFYVGSSFWQDGIEPELEGVELAYNRIERTGWDGLQVGSAVKDVKVHHNVIVDAGLSDSTHSGNGRYGIIVNKGTTGDFYNNSIRSSRRSGIYIQGKGGYRIYNNLIDGSCIADSCSGIRWADGSNGQIYDNTVVNTVGDGITVGSWISGGTIYDNIVAGFTGIGIDPANIPVANNFVSKDLAEARFLNSVGNDFHLRGDSPAVNTGSTGGFAASDLDDRARPQGTRADIGVYEYVAAPTSSQTSAPSRTPTPASSGFTNWGFESGSTGWWNLYSGGSVASSIVSSPVRSGSKSAQIVGSSTNMARWMTNNTLISAAAGQIYTARAYVNRQDVTGNGAYVFLGFWKGTSSSPVYLGGMSSGKVTGTAGWSQLSVSMAAPSETVWARVELRLEGSGSVWWDDVSLTLGTPSLPTPTPAPTSTNLLKNPTFESDPYLNYFTNTNGTATFTWDQTGGRTGKAVKIVSTGSSSTALSRWLTKNATISTTAGRSYTGSVYVKTANNATLTVLFLENGTNIYKAGKSVSATDTAGAWKSLTVTSPAAPTNTYVRFEMRLNGPGTVWFDDAVLK